jgi:prepilin-type N-terminal cleavage/methylation domain-containing protein
MNALRNWLRNERGFTLAELLVVAAIVGLVMAGVFVVQQEGQQAYLLGSNRVETQQNARIALDLMTRELRSATSLVSLSSGTDITFKVCEMDPANPNHIAIPCTNETTRQYSLSGTTLNRLDTSVDNVSRPLIGGVQSMTITYYCVADITGTYTIKTPPVASPSLVSVIKISLTTVTEETVASGSAGDQRALLESTVTLRSSTTKPTSC